MICSIILFNSIYTQRETECQVSTPAHKYTHTYTHTHTHTNTHTDGVPTEHLNPPQGILPTLKAELAKSLSPEGLIFYFILSTLKAELAESLSPQSFYLRVCVCVCVCHVYMCKYTCICIQRWQIAGWG
jgi:hypothetical protein